MADELDDGKISPHAGAGGGDAISAEQLRDMLNEHIPPGTETLIVFSQCFGGNMAKSSHFEERDDTCVLSGSKPGQQSGYGGYHDDAAGALKPKKDLSAKDVHDAGTKGRRQEEDPGSLEAEIWNEDPQVAGKTSPEDFDLQPTGNDGPIHSRHVIVYAGNPTEKTCKAKVENGATVPDDTGHDMSFSDRADRDRIRTNFRNDPNATVEAVGGPPNVDDPSKGQDGWERPGTKGGLEAALKAAGDAIRDAIARDHREQLILFFSDHGEGTRSDEFEEPKKVEKNSRTSLSTPFTPFGAGSSYACAIAMHPEAAPGFELSMDVSRMPFYPDKDPPFGNDELALEAGALRLTNFEWIYHRWNPHGPAGSDPRDKIVLFFPVESERFLSEGVGEPYEVALVNNTSLDLYVTAVGQTTGSVGKLGRRQSDLPLEK